MRTNHTYPHFRGRKKQQGNNQIAETHNKVEKQQ